MSTFPYRLSRRLLLSALCASVFIAAMPSERAFAQDSIDIQINALLNTSYPVSDKPSNIILNPVKLNVLATQVQGDITNFMKLTTVKDPQQLCQIYRTLGEVATIQEDYADALADFTKSRTCESKPVEKMTDCLVQMAVAETLQNPGADFDRTLGANLDKSLAPLPYGTVESYLKESAGSYEVQSASLEQATVAAQIDPAVTDSRITLQFAQAVIASGYLVQVLLPHDDAIAAAFQRAIAANTAPPAPDIWAAKDVTLDPSSSLTPVIIGIWDSGMDTTLFPNNLYTNPTAGSDGYTDDVHGIAWDEHSIPTSGTLYPLTQTPDQIADLQDYFAGYADLSANIDSPEASKLRHKISTLTSDNVRSFMEQENLYNNYVHGTAVTGVAVKGNPAARAQICRITYDYRLLEDAPTVAQAQIDAAAFDKQVTFFKTHGARVVNMSWGGDYNGLVSVLESHQAAGSEADIMKPARKIYSIESDGLYNAIKGAPNILFIVAAGNDDNDLNNNDEYPNDFNLKNMLHVGAVDQSGEQTSFTTTANVDVYADGYGIPCVTPGGQTVTMSGTSFAAPAVTNLAAKLLALNPKLTVDQIKKIIESTCDTNIENGATIKLINPK